MRTRVGRLLRDNGLSLALFGLFAVCIAGQAVAGHRAHNEERTDHGASPVRLIEYLGSGAFVEATMENWESEFLQMCAYVWLTALLYQRGSAESKDPDAAEAVDRDPRRRARHDAPWPVRRGGLVLALYAHSLGLALFLLFLGSFALHALGGAQEFSRDALLHGEAPIGALAYVGTARFWFESLQNWQSEFVSIGFMVVLSIVLRERGSPESKPVDAPHRATGHE